MVSCHRSFVASNTKTMAISYSQYNIQNIECFAIADLNIVVANFFYLVLLGIVDYQI